MQNESKKILVSKERDNNFIQIGKEIVNLNSIKAIVLASTPRLHYRVLLGNNEFIGLYAEEDATKLKNYLLGGAETELTTL